MLCIYETQIYTKINNVVIVYDMIYGKVLVCNTYYYYSYVIYRYTPKKCVCVYTYIYIYVYM